MKPFSLWTSPIRTFWSICSTPGLSTWYYLYIEATFKYCAAQEDYGQRRFSMWGKYYYPT